MKNVGAAFLTQNSVVAELPIGTVLKKTKPGTLMVVELPAKEFKVGDRIQSKYGPATVVRLSSRFEAALEDFNADEQILYVADGTTVVRIADKSSVDLI